MQREILELISIFLESKRYDVDYDDGVLIVADDDSDSEVKVIVEEVY